MTKDFSYKRYQDYRPEEMIQRLENKKNSF